MGGGRTYGKSSRPTRPAPKTILTPSAHVIEAGIVPQAGKKELAFQLTNATAEPVEIASFDHSCGCVEVQLPKKVLSPSETISACILIDLSREAEFTGLLSLDLKGKTPEGALAFYVECPVDVRPQAVTGKEP